MDIQIHEKADKYLNSLDKKTQIMIRGKLKELSSNTHSRLIDIKQLKGIKNNPDIYRLRVGNYRMIYFIQDEKIWITDISTRQQAYSKF